MPQGIPPPQNSNNQQKFKNFDGGKFRVGICGEKWEEPN